MASRALRARFKTTCFQLGAICLDPVEGAAEAQHDLAVLAHQPAEHRLHIHQHAVELEHIAAAAAVRRL
jgi:hypothetical protein